MPHKSPVFFKLRLLKVLIISSGDTVLNTKFCLQLVTWFFSINTASEGDDGSERVTAVGISEKKF